jgi:hypothetical protein
MTTATFKVLNMRAPRHRVITDRSVCLFRKDRQTCLILSSVLGTVRNRG